MRRLAAAVALLLILGVALGLRLPRLNDRPFHGDEAVHAVKLSELWQQGRYEYDPDEYHGPTLYYAALPVVAAKRSTFAETREADYRLAVALVGAGMVLLLPLVRGGLGAGGVLWAGLFLAVSAPFVFYSRYFIQETLLVGFTLGLMACGWRYVTSGRTGWLLAAGVCAGLMMATKETWVLTFAALGLGWLAARPELKGPREAGAGPGGRWRLLAAGLVALGVAFVLLSGLFSHVEGALRYWQTYAPWLRRAGGTDLHRQPWHYYFSLLAWQRVPGGVWTEALILALAAVGAAAAFFRRRLERVSAHPGFVRFILVYSLALAVFYSALPYKTPWNLLSFHLGFILLAGLGASVLVQWLPTLPARALAGLVLLAGAGHLGWQSGRTTFHYRDDNTGPYAYAQPQRGVSEIEERVRELAAFSPRKSGTVVQVVFSDAYYWPLPWTLRGMENVGYWSAGVPREEEAGLKRAAIVLSSAELDAELTERLGSSHFMIGFHALRPGVLVQVWVKNELWEPFVMSRSPQP